jgi:hypothetical protein
VGGRIVEQGFRVRARRISGVAGTRSSGRGGNAPGSGGGRGWSR